MRVFCTHNIESNTRKLKGSKTTLTSHIFLPLTTLSQRQESATDL